MEKRQKGDLKRGNEFRLYVLAELGRLTSLVLGCRQGGTGRALCLLPVGNKTPGSWGIGRRSLLLHPHDCQNGYYGHLSRIHSDVEILLKHLLLQSFWRTWWFNFYEEQDDGSRSWELNLPPTDPRAYKLSNRCGWFMFLCSRPGKDHWIFSTLLFKVKMCGWLMKSRGCCLTFTNGWWTINCNSGAPLWWLWAFLHHLWNVGLSCENWALFFVQFLPLWKGNLAVS